MDTGSFSTSLFCAILVLLLVAGMPLIDTLVCRKIGLNPVGGKKTSKGQKKKTIVFGGSKVYY